MQQFYRNYQGPKIKYCKYYFSLTLMFTEFWQRSPISSMKFLAAFIDFMSVDNWVPVVDEALYGNIEEKH